MDPGVVFVSSERKLHCYRRRVMPKIVGFCIAGAALVAIDMFAFAHDDFTRYFGLVLAVPTTVYAVRGFRMATICAFETGLVVRSLWRTYRLQWNEIESIGVWDTASGYGGRGYSIRVTARSGRSIKLGEFWSPATRNPKFPDCPRIAGELDHLRQQLS